MAYSAVAVGKHTHQNFQESFDLIYSLINALVLGRLFVLIFCSQEWLDGGGEPRALWHQCPFPQCLLCQPPPHPRQVRPPVTISHTRGLSGAGRTFRKQVCPEV